MREVASCYYVLGLDKEATLNDVKLAYRKLAKRYHPDIMSNGNRFANLAGVERFKKINSAYDYLRRRCLGNNRARYSGWLGFSIAMRKFNKKTCPVVSRISVCSPAALAGLCVNDYIVGFNDCNTLGMAKREIGNLFSGKAGVPVKMKVYRRSKKAIYTLYTVRLPRPRR